MYPYHVTCNILISKYIIKFNPKYTLVMSKRQTITKPSHIQCDTCKAVVLHKDAFFAYNFECCSLECLRPLRDRVHALECAKQEEREVKRPRFGAFTFHGGAI